MTDTLHIYTRVSTTVQEEEGTSLDTQQELGIERSLKLGFDYRLWNEGGQSSAKDDLSNRPVLTDLLSEIDNGTIKHLYVWNTDRLSRNIATWGMIRLKLISNDVTLHTPTGEQLLSDPATNMMIGIMGEVAQYDNQLRTERFRLGKLKRVREGGWMGGPPPFGYKLANGKLVPNEDEAKWVKFIFESYVDGTSVDGIRTELMNNGVETRRGNPIWSHGSIQALLRNPHYGGYYNYHDKKSGDSIRVSCPAILESKLVATAKSQMETRSYKRTGSRRSKTGVTKHTYLLTDIMYCSHCGNRFSGNLKQKQTSYYRCRTKDESWRNSHRDDYGGCNSNRNLQIEKTDEVIWETVVDVLSGSNLFRERIKQETLGEKSLRQSTVDMKRVQSQIARVEGDIQKVTDSIVNLNTERLIGNVQERDIERIISNLEKRRDELEVRQNELIATLDTERQSRVWVDWLKEFGNRVDQLRNPSMSIADRKRFLSGVVERIDVESVDKQKHKIDIKFALPCVNDKLVKDSSGKNQVKEGKDTKTLRSNLLKKSTV